MNKVAPLFASAMIAVLTACGSANLPMARMQAPQMMAPRTAQVSSQSILGINKEIKRSVEANFVAKDANKDGLITPNEFPVESPEDFNHFRRLDNNQDGQLKMDEMATGILGRLNDIMQIKAMAAFVFDELDVDNNKRLTKTEIAASKVPGVAANFEKYLGKNFFTRQPLDYLRKSDFENLMAFAMLNPGAVGQEQQSQEEAMMFMPVDLGQPAP